jgi:hypothetical protein
VNIGIEAFLQALRDHRAAKCLSDSRKRRVLQPDAQKALVESWIPQAAALGLKRLAIVLPISQVALSTVESLMSRYREYVETEAFGTVEEAAAWLSVESAAVMAQA